MRIKSRIQRSTMFRLYRDLRRIPTWWKKSKALPYDERPKRMHYVIERSSKVIQLKHAIASAEIIIDPSARFQMWIDTGVYIACTGAMLGNNTPDYSMVINQSLTDIRNNRCDESDIGQQNKEVLNIAEDKINQVIKKIESDFNDCDYQSRRRLERTATYYRRMITHRAESLEEALQRILFWSSLFWQTNHPLVGIGPLDRILARFEGLAENDSEVIADFLISIHKYYVYKSNGEKGDTGQIIELGGLSNDGEYYCNFYTYQFIKTMMELHIPDPKLLLKVSKLMPCELLELAVKCISTGIGHPILANDDVIVPCLLDAGYTAEEANGYVVAACWEPLILGRSMDVGNTASLNLAAPITDVCESVAQLNKNQASNPVETYLSKLDQNINNLFIKLDNISWEPDPLFTLFTEGCIESDVDISRGGAVHSDYGITTVGLATAVDSLLYLEDIISGDRAITLQDLPSILKTDYLNRDDIKADVLAARRFATDDKRAIELVHTILEHMDKKLGNYTNPLGGRIKWGLSSPDYVVAGKTTGATLDGRIGGDPLPTHISSPGGTPYTSTVSFASRLNYSGRRSNGNVVDLFVSPTLIDASFKKFVDFIQMAISIGFFEMQMNVVSSSALIAARDNPDAYPDLIVRVWGFSAYFIDLSPEYQDALIRRALESEESIPSDGV